MKAKIRKEKEIFVIEDKPFNSHSNPSEKLELAGNEIKIKLMLGWVLVIEK